MQPLSEDAFVVVLEELDAQAINANKIGDIKITDGGLSVNCSYYENILNLKKLARENGANLVKITYHKPADKWSSCDRFSADLYFVENVYQYEVDIVWSADRKLNWDDFKGVPTKDGFPDAAAVTNSGFGSYSNTPDILHQKAKFFVVAKFYKNTSWVWPEQKNDYILNHEQLHFDLAEIYARKYRKALEEAELQLGSIYKAEDIFNTYYSEFEARQNRYDADTEHGLNERKQEQWNAIVELELAKYDLYKISN